MAQGTSHDFRRWHDQQALSGKIAHRAGCGVIISSGTDAALFQKLLDGQSVGTYFVPSNEPVKSHKRWIAIQDNVHGKLTIYAGAADAIQQSGKSLLSAGVRHSEGEFEEGDVVAICNEDGAVIAQGQVQLDASAVAEAVKAAALASSCIVIIWCYWTSLRPYLLRVFGKPWALYTPLLLRRLPAPGLLFTAPVAVSILPDCRMSI